MSRPRFFSRRCFNVEAESAGVQASAQGKIPPIRSALAPSARSRSTGAADSGLLLPARGRWVPPPPRDARRCLPPRAAAAAASQTVRFDFLRFLGKLAFEFDEGDELRVEASCPELTIFRYASLAFFSLFFLPLGLSSFSSSRLPLSSVAFAAEAQRHRLPDSLRLLLRRSDLAPRRPGKLPLLSVFHSAAIASFSLLLGSLLPVDASACAGLG